MKTFISIGVWTWATVRLVLAGQLPLVSHETSQRPHRSPIRVAIIGAGAGGSSAAYHMRQYAEQESLPIEITVYDRDDDQAWPGRSTTVVPFSDDGEYIEHAVHVELGGSIFVEVNSILVEAVNKFNLTTTSSGERVRDMVRPSLGIWDGEQFVVTLSDSGPTWWDTAKLLWRYGLAPIRTRSLMKATVGKFLKMYSEPHFPFQSLSQAVEEVDLLPAISISGADLLALHNVGLPFAHDIIQASTRVNYAQNLEFIHGLETMVCMATDGAMAVEGGNWQIFMWMVSAADLFHPSTMVRTISAASKGRIQIGTGVQYSDRMETFTHEYDAVIIAAPYHQANISVDLPDMHIPEKVPYVHLHVTLFTSRLMLSRDNFGLNGDDFVPQTILTTLADGEKPRNGAEAAGKAGFYSISLLDAIINPHTGGENLLYKIFSPAELSDKHLSKLVGCNISDPQEADCITWVHRKLWQSYPYETPRTKFDPIELSHNLWYTGGMDPFISTMETNALMGKNVARLLVDRFAAERHE